jgi:hypothetical protein
MPTVHIVYLVPADREASKTYVRALEASAITLQAWYQEQLGGSETYRLTKPVVDVIQTTHDAEWYATNPTAGDPVLQYWDNALASAGVNARSSGAVAAEALRAPTGRRRARPWSRTGEQGRGPR